MADHQDYAENCAKKESREGDYLLIDLVRQNPHLYNKDLKDFKDIDKREHTWQEIASMVNLNVTNCQQRWVRLREKFSKERRVQEELERSGNKEFKLSSWPFYDELRFLEPFIKRRKVYIKPRDPEQKANNTTINQKVNTTVFNAQPLRPLKPIPAVSVNQPVGFKQGNLSFVQVPKTVMVQLVGNQNHVSNPTKTVEPLSGDPSLPNNVEVVYQNEATTSSESYSSTSENENPSNKKKKRKRKYDDTAEKVLSNISSVIQACLDPYKKDDSPDELFGKLIASELSERAEPEKSRLKRSIMNIIWDDSQES